MAVTMNVALPGPAAATKAGVLLSTHERDDTVAVDNDRRPARNRDITTP